MDDVMVLHEVRTGIVRSLVWDGDDLLDPLGGWRRWSADGREHPRRRRGYGMVFDRAVTSPSGRWTVVYTERGTRGLLLDGRQVVRKIRRDDNYAGDFDYPVGLGALADGREVLVHCPEDSTRLEIEDVATGERLTTGERDPLEVFHSRPAISPGGRWLLSAGWVWHPAGIVNVYDLPQALTDATVLDGDGLLPYSPGREAEVDAACWLDGDRLAMVTGDGGLEPTEENGMQLGGHRLAVWSFAAERWLYRHRLPGPMGTILACGEAVLALYGHPRLFDIRTGDLVAEWPELEMPQREGSYGVTWIPTPVATVHPDGTRVALVVKGGIAVIRIP